VILASNFLKRMQNEENKDTKRGVGSSEEETRQRPADESGKSTHSGGTGTSSNTEEDMDMSEEE
jgi:hypothetical protein